MSADKADAAVAALPFSDTAAAFDRKVSAAVAAERDAVAEPVRGARADAAVAAAFAARSDRKAKPACSFLYSDPYPRRAASCW